MLRHTGPSESCNVTMVAWLCGWPVRRRSQEGARDLKARAFLPPPCRPRLVPLSLLKSKIHVHASLLHIRCGLPCSLGLERRWDGRVWSPYALDMRKVRLHPSSVDPCQLTFLHKAGVHFGDGRRPTDIKRRLVRLAGRRALRRRCARASDGVHPTRLSHVSYYTYAINRVPPFPPPRH